MTVVRTRPSVAWLLLALTVRAAAAQQGGAPVEAPSPTEQWIAALGADSYTDRQSAAVELEAIGLAAVEPLIAASSDPDPEIAAASRRLLDRLAPRWVRSPDDPPRVRQFLATYAAEPEQQRLQRVEFLLEETNQEGIAALVRIARFDTSSLVAKAAATELTELTLDETEPRAVEQIERALRAIEREAGPALRQPGQWCELIADRKTPAPQIASAWRRSADEQSARAEAGDPLAKPFARILRWRQARAELNSGANPQQLADTIAVIVAGQPVEPVLEQALLWMLEEDRRDCAAELIARFGKSFQSKRLKYLHAIVAEETDDSGAPALVEAAYWAEPAPRDGGIFRRQEGFDLRLGVAHWLEEQQRPDWAWREYRRVLDSKGPVTLSQACAAAWLSESLADHERYEESAEVSLALMQRIEADPQSAQNYAVLCQRWALAPSPQELRASEALHRAAACRIGGDGAGELDWLEKAWSFDDRNADILIAQYRSPTADPSTRARTRERIRTLAASTRREIERDPAESTPYNQWAWLIANTEGDYQQAVRFSQRSLELRPEDPGYLDTLGRCWFAVGDIEKAIESQRLAVSKAPHLQVMRRQLAEFQRAAEAAAEPNNAQ